MKIAELIEELEEVESGFSFDIKPGQFTYCLKCKNFKCKKEEHDDFWIDGTEFEIVLNVLDYLLREERR